jgi:hypothetical protein
MRALAFTIFVALGILAAQPVSAQQAAAQQCGWGPAGGFFGGDRGTAWSCRPAPAPVAKKVRRGKR